MINVTYNAGRQRRRASTTAQLRNGHPRFWGSDDPPTPAQVAR